MRYNSLWKSTDPVLAALAYIHQNEHEYFWYRVTMTDGPWTFDASGEAACLELLTNELLTRCAFFSLKLEA